MKIALIGLDGSGKSANINLMKSDPEYKGFECLNYWRNSKYSARNKFLFYKMDRMYFSIMYYNWCLNRNMGFIWCKKI